MMADLKSIQDQIYCSGEKKMRNRDGVDNTNALYLFKKNFLVCISWVQQCTKFAAIYQS